MQHHEGDGDAQLNSPAGAVKNAGIAVPALFTEKNPGHLVFPGNMAEYLSGADVGTGAAADAQFTMDDGRHVFLLLLSGGALQHLVFLKAQNGHGDTEDRQYRGDPQTPVAQRPYFQISGHANASFPGARGTAPRMKKDRIARAFLTVF